MPRDINESLNHYISGNTWLFCIMQDGSLFYSSRRVDWDLNWTHSSNIDQVRGL